MWLLTQAGLGSKAPMLESTYNNCNTILSLTQQQSFRASTFVIHHWPSVEQLTTSSWHVAMACY